MHIKITNVESGRVRTCHADEVGKVMQAVIDHDINRQLIANHPGEIMLFAMELASDEDIALQAEWEKGRVQ